jgi:hypothetical protein
MAKYCACVGALLYLARTTTAFATAANISTKCVNQSCVVTCSETIPCCKGVRFNYLKSWARTTRVGPLALSRTVQDQYCSCDALRLQTQTFLWLRPSILRSIHTAFFGCCGCYSTRWVGVSGTPSSMTIDASHRRR